MLQVWKYQRNKIHKEVVSFQFEWSLAAVVNTGKPLGSSPLSIDVVTGGSKY